jgi:hypothetical protein
MNCIPEASIGGGNPYAEQIVQTPNRVTFISEFNHVIRRIYLDRPMPEKIAPSYNGYSVGHWEGNMLVVETRGLRSFRMMGGGLASLDRVIERISKSVDGKQVTKQVRYEGRDAAGNAAAFESNISYQLNAGQHLYEFICEEGAGDFQGLQG